MAVVVTAVGTTFTRIPFIKPPDMVRMYSAMPRAVVACVANAAVVDAKPLNDQQTLQVAVDLPFQFAYRMISSEIRFVNQGANNWEDNAELHITNGLRGQPLGVLTIHKMVKAATLTFSPIAAALMYTFPVIPSMIIQSVSRGAAPVVDYRMVNNAAAASVAGVLHFLATFYEYDIEQVQMFPAMVPGTLTYDLSS